jgi:hypothetical protein
VCGSKITHRKCGVGLKGLEFNIAILEEAAIIPPSMMEVIAPCLLVANSVFIAISTATGSDNYLSQMFANENQKARELLIRIHVERHCKSCKQQGLSAEKCLKAGHTDDMLPAHQSSQALEQVQLLMPQEELLASEVAGGIRQNALVFKAEWINQIVANKPMRLAERSVSNCYSWIDPSGGGSQSDFAIITIVVLELPPLNPRISIEPRRIIVIIGLSRDRNQNEVDEQRCVYRHFASLRKLYTLQPDAILTMFTESNYGGGPAAGRIQSYVNQDEFQPIFRVQERIGRPGVTTTQYTKQEAIGMGIHELSQGNVYFAADMATSDPDNLDKNKLEMLEQLKRIQKKLKKTSGGYTYEYTGKAGANMRDDLGMGLLFNLFWTGTLQSQELYNRQSGHFLPNPSLSSSSRFSV